MPDWKQYIAAKLRLQGLRTERVTEIVEDLAQQLEDAYQDGLSRGMSEAEAAAFARDQIPDWHALARSLEQSRRGTVTVSGRLETAADDASVQGGWRSAFASIGQDLLFGLRMMRKNAGFTAAAVLTLALGIGANSTIFGVINATLLKKLTLPDPDRLTLLWLTTGKGPDNENIVSAPTFWDWQRQNHAFEHIAVFDSAGKGYNLAADTAQHDTEQVSGVRVSADFFATLGVQPFLGRGFLKEEETTGKDREVVLSYGLWQRRYGADPKLLGSEIRMDGEQYTVVGIMPRDFQFQFWNRPRELWVPAGWTAGDQSRDSNSFIAIGRLKPGVRVAEAQVEMDTIQHRIAREYKEERENGVWVVRMSDYGLKGVQRISLALFAAVGFVLLIGCINVANLMLARGAERRKEFGIRRALGASATRVIRQMLAESVLLAMTGGAAGLLLAYWGTQFLKRILPPDFLVLPMRPFEGISLDGRVLGFTFAVTFVTAILFGIAPALVAIRGDVQDSLKEGSRGSTQGGKHALRHALVACEVSLAIIVLCAAGLMIKSMSRLVAVDPGFDPQHVLVTELSLPQTNTYYGPPTHPRFCLDLDQQVTTIPAVKSVGAAAHLPMAGNAGRAFLIEGRAVPAQNETPSGSYTVTCPGYFRTMGIPLLKGRDFQPEDTIKSTQVVIINERLARKHWGEEDPVGKRIDVDQQGHWETIVGVVGDTHQFGLAQAAPRQLFRPYTQAAWPWMQVVVRTEGDPLSVTRAVKDAMAKVEPERGVSKMRTMESIVDASLGSRRFPMLVLAAFSALALLLAAIGIVGVVSYSVTQRRNEIGIRMALGARARDVLQLVVAGSMRWVLLGVVIGIAGALAATRFLVTLLFEVRPADPLVLSAVVALLMTVASIASYTCARRATQVDPLVTLRSE